MLEALARLFGALRRAPVPVVLYSRPGCHLCELMKAELARSRARGEFELREVDIDADPRLVERWGHSIPVLEIGGHVAFKTTLSAPEFERKFARLAAEWRSAQARTRVEERA